MEVALITRLKRLPGTNTLAYLPDLGEYMKSVKNLYILKPVSIFKSF